MGPWGLCGMGEWFHGLNKSKVANHWSSEGELISHHHTFPLTAGKLLNCYGPSSSPRDGIHDPGPGSHF